MAADQEEIIQQQQRRAGGARRRRAQKQGLRRPATAAGAGHVGAAVVGWSLYRVAIAEFVATLLFLYVTVATVIGHERQWERQSVLGIAWAFGGMIFLLVYCTAGISGGDINPAVTLALLLARKVSLPRAALYVAAQCLGAVSGAGLLPAIHSRDSFARHGGGANAVDDGYGRGTGLAAEVVGTFVLVYTVFSATDAKRNARDSHIPWIFWVGPLIGAAIGPSPRSTTSTSCGQVLSRRDGALSRLDTPQVLGSCVDRSCLEGRAYIWRQQTIRSDKAS